MGKREEEWSQRTSNNHIKGARKKISTGYYRTLGPVVRPHYLIFQWE
jgi:hypothetical protein